MKLYWSGVFFVIIVIVTAYDYIVDFSRAELAYHDKKLVKDGYFLFRKYNRTNYCLNVSFVLLEDLNGNDMEFTTSGYQLLSNQYRKLGVAFRFNVCEYWKKDIMGTTSHLAKFGHLEGCNITKGHYYLYNYMPDENQFPKYLPLGIYMVEINVKWKSGTRLLKIEWYVTAKLKLKGRIYEK